MKKFKRVFSIQWHVTDLCDQRCKHCYLYGKNRTPQPREELDLDKMFNIVDDYLNFCELVKCDPYFSITGGDPLLFSNIWQFLKYVKKKNIRFSILGNPFHLNNKVAKRLHSLGCQSYQMSLDGLQKTHDKLRKQGSFDITLSKLKYLKQNKIRATIMNTVSKLNYKELPALIRIVVKRNVDSFGFARYCPTPDDVEFMLSPLEYKKLLSTVWDTFNEISESKTNFVLKDHLWTLFLYEKGLFKIDKNNKSVLEGCNCGIKHMTLLPDGTVYACRRFDSPVGKVPEQSFQEIFFSNQMNQYREIDKFEGCKECELFNYCRGCHAVSYGASGNFFAKDPQCWKNN